MSRPLLPTTKARGGKRTVTYRDARGSSHNAVVTGAGGNAVDEVQSLAITGTPGGGTFTVSFTGPTGISATSAPIAYNAAAATVQTALEAMASIGAGNVVCTGGALPGTAVTLTFAGTLAGKPLALATANGAALTGGTTPAAAITRTTAGVAATQLNLRVPHLPQANRLKTNIGRSTTLVDTNVWLP